MANAKKLEGTFTFDSDKKNTKLFRADADKEKQISNAVYVRKDKLGDIDCSDAKQIKVTIEVVE